MVCSRLDYCNSMLVSLTDFELRTLQRVQKLLCGVFTHSSYFSHIIPHLRNLTICLITYKILNQGPTAYIQTSSEMQGLAPLNLSSFIPPILTIEFTNQTNTFLILSVTMPSYFPFHITNNPSVTSFRKHLKTHLFTPGFPN